MEEVKKSSLSIEDRKKLNLSGVLEVINFDEDKITLNTVLGTLTIKGEGLKMNKLDVQNGDVMVFGYISSMIYSGKSGKKSKESLVKKLFK